jgi:cation-transporting ATPase I
VPLEALGRAVRFAARGITSGEQRLVRTRPGQAYIPVRGLTGPRAETLARSVEQAVGRLRGVRWAQVNPVLAQVVVSFEDGKIAPDDLVGVVGAVEQAHGADDDELPPDIPDHPADPVPISRAATALAADAVGLGVSIAARAIRAPALPVEVASALVGVDSIPPVRRLLDQHPRASTATAIVNAALQGLGQGPLGLVVDGAHRVTTLRELGARRHAWLTAEPHLCGGLAAEPIEPEDPLARPVPLPPTLAERYAQAASLAALGGAGLTLATTRDARRTADVLLAGVPRAARLGVESFAAQIDRSLCERGVVVMDPRPLRRLDLIDTVVVDASLLKDRAAPALMESIRAAAHDLVVAGRLPARVEVNADIKVAGGTRLARAIHDLQAEGRVVALVSHRYGGALRAADCGIGVAHPGQSHPPWGADVICMDLSEVAPVIDATRLARTAGRQAAALSALGSTAAGVLALGPLPGAGRRAVTAVQAASLAAMAAGAWTAARLPAPPPSPANEDPDVPWHAVAAEDAVQRLQSRPGGLTGEEARSRRRPDDSPKSPSFPALVGQELTNPLTAVLGVGAGLSALTGSLIDAALIGGVITLDAAIGATQRLRTESAIAKLGRGLTEGRARVVRDERETVQEATAVVPGDIVVLSAGDAVPADGRIVEAAGLEVDESALTGESLPAAKDPMPVDVGMAIAERTSMVYAGTSVAAGRAKAVVVATGSATEAGRATKTTAAVSTGVESRLEELTRRTVPAVLAAGAGLTANGLLRRVPAGEAIGAGVSLATSAVPEGLPFVATAAQSATARRLAASDVLVRNPHVLEALGRVDVLCFDKTGTLTEGRLRVTRVSDGVHEQQVRDMDSDGQAVLAAALRATPRARPGGLPHPTDQAVVEAASSAGLHLDHGIKGWKKVSSLPFEPGRGYHAVIGRTPHGVYLSVKGAPEVVLPRCTIWRRGDQTHPLHGASRDRINAEVDRLARLGLRILAVAERNGSRPDKVTDDDVDQLELVGFLGVSDEARSDAAEPLSLLHRAGVDIVMITGDHPSTAEAVASDLGLINGRGVMTGPDIEAMDDAELDGVIDKVAVFARVTPADKVRIVGAFQRAGRIVAMTGDGANDAQAIRLAQVGVAFGSRSTPAAQQAADIVIARDDLGALIETMVEGRAMWASVRDALAILLGGNLGEVAFATGAALATGRSPLSPRQLLTVNLFTDLAPAMAIAVQPPQSGRADLAREGPDTSLSGRLARDIGLRAGATAAGAYGAWIAARLTGTPTRARTVALAALVGSQLGQTLVIGRRSPLVIATSLISAGALATVIETPGLSNLFDCRPLGPLGWSIVLTSAFVATAGSVAADALIP